MNFKNEIPEGWEEVALEELIEFVIGGDWGKDENHDDPDFENAYCIRGAEIKNWNENKGNTASLRKIKKTSLKNRILIEGDILVEISGGGPEQPVGRTVLIDRTVLNYKPEIPKICTNFLRLLRPSKRVEPEFLNLFLKLFYYSGEIVKYQAGSNNLRNLKFNDFTKIKIPLPPIDEQHEIVLKIEELFSELDKGVEALKTARSQLKVYRQSVLKYAFEGKLTNAVLKDGELPEGWVFKKLGEVITSISAGKSFSCDERPPRNGEVGVLKVSALTWGEYDEEESKTVIDDSKINLNYYVKPGDFLFSRANTIELIGASVLVKNVQKALMLSDKTLRIEYNSEVDKRYILYYLRSKKGKSEIQRLSTGNQESMRNIGQAKIKEIEFPLPPLKEQHQIVQEIESRLSVCDKLEETISDGLLKAETLRQSILKRAFEGKLVVKNKVAEFTPKNVYFYQLQILGYLNYFSKLKGIRHGEMTAAKYAYLLDRIFKIKTFYDFKRWHLGPYPPEMKPAINNKKYFNFKNGGIEVVNTETLFKYDNPFKNQVESAINDLAEIFSSFKEGERSHKTELLATICKVIEDIQSTDFKEVRDSMAEWKIELKTSPFKNKAEKFGEEETLKCLQFLTEKKWDKKLLA